MAHNNKELKTYEAEVKGIFNFRITASSEEEVIKKLNEIADNCCFLDKWECTIEVEEV